MLKKDKSFLTNVYNEIVDMLRCDPLTFIIIAGGSWAFVSLTILLILAYPILLPISLISIVLLAIAYKFIKFMAEAEDIDG